MTHEREYILSLTRIAALNAILLSLVSIQFVIPVAFLFLLWSAPAVFAFQLNFTSIRFYVISGIMVTLSAVMLFGLDIGFWTVVYFFVGSVLGLSWRMKCHRLLRLLLLGASYVLTLIIALLFFSWLAQISWQGVTAATIQFERVLFSLSHFLLFGLLGLAGILSTTSDWFFKRVWHQLADYKE